MRRAIIVSGFAAIVMGGVTYGQSPEAGKPARPKVYALIAAIGDQFTLIQQKQSTGSHFAPYERVSVTMPKNVLNRSVLVGLDQAIASTDPGSKRVYFNLPAADMDSVKEYDRESVALSDVVAILEKMPERAEWDSIVIATPAYKAFELNGVAGRLAGFGVFYQGQGGGRDIFSNIPDFGDAMGEETVSPEGKPVRNVRYSAPFSFIEVWVLDPKTLKVVDRQRRFDNKKLFDPYASAANITQNIDKTVMMKNVASLIERSTYAAVTHSAILNSRGMVDVGNVREAKPEAKKE
jgi:hypothetical protein